MAAYDYINLTGVIVPDATDQLEEVQQEYKDAFGDQSLVVTPDTPQGVLITAESLSRIGIARNNALLANQINPNFSGGIFLDAIWALTGGSRLSNTHTTVNVVMTGVPNTLITSNVRIKGSNNFLFRISAPINLSAAGTATIDFIAVDPGPIPALANSLTQIDVGVLGLETVNNPGQGILGTLEESDDDSRKRRRNTLALQGSATLLSVTSGLYDTENVISLSSLENVENTVEVIENVTMNAHSLYVCVDGGTDSDVANTIFNKKSGGCNYTNGASSLPVDFDIQGPSGVIYTVKFDRPDELQVLIRVTVRSNGFAVNPTAAVKQAVLDYAYGRLPGQNGLVVGASVSVFEIAGAIKIQIPQIDVVLVESTLASVIDYDTAEIPIEVFEKAVILNESSVTVIVL